MLEQARLQDWIRLFGGKGALDRPTEILRGELLSREVSKSPNSSLSQAKSMLTTLPLPLHSDPSPCPFNLGFDGIDQGGELIKHLLKNTLPPSVHFHLVVT